LAVFGDRWAAIAKELTKIHESVRRGRLSELLANLEENPKGEYVVLVAGKDIEDPSQRDSGVAHSYRQLSDGPFSGCCRMRRLPIVFIGTFTVFADPKDAAVPRENPGKLGIERLGQGLRRNRCGRGHKNTARTRLILWEASGSTDSLLRTVGNSEEVIPMLSRDGFRAHHGSPRARNPYLGTCSGQPTR
jgi:hypothetical protein